MSAISLARFGPAPICDIAVAHRRRYHDLPGRRPLRQGGIYRRRSMERKRDARRLYIEFNRLGMPRIIGSPWVGEPSFESIPCSYRCPRRRLEFKASSARCSAGLGCHSAIEDFGSNWRILAEIAFDRTSRSAFRCCAGGHQCAYQPAPWRLENLSCNQTEAVDL